ncbi:MAG: ATP-binding protein [Candidatus Margulisiibacteriota bacterium]
MGAIEIKVPVRDISTIRFSNGVFNRIPTPAVVISRVFRKVSHVNPQFLALMGADNPQILNRRIDSFIHPNYLDNFYKAIKAATPCQGTELVFLHATGATRPIPTAIANVKNGYLMRVLSTKSDMALDINSSFSEIGAGFVHDMSNVLGVTAYEELLDGDIKEIDDFLRSLCDGQAQESPDDLLQGLPQAITALDGIRSRLKTIFLGLNHANSILQGFGCFCKGRPETNATPHFEVADAVRSAAAMGKGIAYAIAKKKGIVISVSHQGPDERLCALGDSSQLQRVIINLIKNAALESKRATNCIIVEWSAIENDAQEKFVEIKVRDSGVPIPKPLADRLFRETVESTHGGTGRGLLTCAQIIHGFGGEIRYQSIPVKSFVITLRAAH